MRKNTVIALESRQAIADPLTKMLPEGATGLILQVVAAELAELPATHSKRRMADGRPQLSYAGYLPKRGLWKLANNLLKLLR